MNETILSILSESADPEIQNLISEDFKLELSELQKVAEAHGYIRKIIKQLNNQLIRNGDLSDPRKKFAAADKVWQCLAPIMADRFLCSIGWSFMAWEPTIVGTGDVDLRLSAPDGQVIDFQIKGPDSRGEVINYRNINGEIDCWVDAAIKNAIKQIPQNCSNPFVIIIVPNRNFPLSDMTDCVEALMYGSTECRQGQPPFISKEMRKLFFSSAEKVAAVIVLNTYRMISGGFKYDPVTLINPKMPEQNARFTEGRVCYLEENQFRWTPKPPKISTILNGTILEN